MLRVFKCCLRVVPVILVLVLAVSPQAFGQCTLLGNVEASPKSSQPDLGSWEYTLTIDWDTGTGYFLHHFDIFLEEGFRGCSCSQLRTGAAPDDTVGFSEEAPDRGCRVYYYPEYMCSGDPTVPIDGIMLKFEPFLGQPHAPGSSGQGVFKFFSDFSPVTLNAPNLILTDTGGTGYYCLGMIAGVFPGLPCDPLEPEGVSWGYLKALYGD